MEEHNLISYKPFWKTLEASKETTYTLTNKHGVSSATMHRLKHNMPLTTYTICNLCKILDCQVQDIFECRQAK